MMAEQKQGQVFEIAIIGRVIWNLHSLNNEGTIGNVTEPRTVVLWDGTKTDGVSGEMMKHIHAFWTWLQAKENNLSLCQACKELKPERANADRRLRQNEWQEVLRSPKNERPKVAVNKAIVQCAMCDLHGFLIAPRTEGEEGQGRRRRSQEDRFPAVHRTSVIEFGWVVGIPQKFHRDLHLHARHSQEEQAREQGEQAREGEERVTAQMLYHRPTRSGVYAFVTLFQVWRIGLNEVNYTYALNDENERKKRFKLALTAYEWTFKRPDGAMTTTRLPHIEGAEGLVLVAKTAVPVPLLSPLREDYRQQLQDLAQRQGIEVYGFDDLAKLTEILTELRQLSPFRINAPSQQ